MTATLRALLALALVGALRAMVVVMALAYAVFAVAVLTLAFSSEVRMDNPTLLTGVVMMCPAVAAVLNGVLGGVRRTGPLPGTARVTRGEAPELWELVTGLARRVNAPPPTEIRLTLEANAAVSEDGGPFGRRTEVRRLYLGVPLLAGLRAEELRAVLCHELAHYTRGHARFAAAVHRGSAALHAARAALERAYRDTHWYVASYGAIQRGSLRLYARFYDTVSLSVRRRTEYEADAAAAAVAGRRATAEALSCAHMLAAAWGDFRARFLDPVARHTGRCPDDPMAAFRAMLTDPGYGTLLAEWYGQRPPAARHDRWSAHPALADRLTALAALPGPLPAPERDLRPARVLLGAAETLPAAAWRTLSRGLAGEPPAATGRGHADRGGAGRRGTGRSPAPGGVSGGPPGRQPAGVRRARTARLGTGPGEPRPVPWRDWLDEAAELRGTAPLAGLPLPLGLLLPESPAPLEAVLTLLESGRGQELEDALRTTGWGREWGHGPYEGRRDATAAALRALAGHALVVAGRARRRIAWRGPSVPAPLDLAAETALELAPAAAADPQHVPELRERLDRCAASTRLPVPAPPVPAVDGAVPATPAPTGFRRRVPRPGLAAAVVAAVLITLANMAVDERPHQPMTGPADSTHDRPGAPSFTDGPYGHALPGGGADGDGPYEIPQEGTGTLPGGPPLGDGLPQEPLVPLDRLTLPPAEDLLPTGTVVVAPGETLSQLACRYDTTVEDLMARNDLTSTRLRAGQELEVPSGLVGLVRTDCD
ncbi:M48 family metalloprotease [Streptomyces sp. JJ36]|uniref:M48 family metalloprotease n=1 Tax=Streptomyces sp. JJ36 TaxID=2736645 RepID=UPI001F00B6F6|nr:M48 family metalloprotease [Streptomyces sp. JJ36]MCF6522829.1 M48 family metalloprotease [Streptomyces sp. JJ36]